MFEWGDEANQKDGRAKEVKRQQLLELVEYIGVFACVSISMSLRVFSLEFAYFI